MRNCTAGSLLITDAINADIGKSTKVLINPSTIRVEYELRFCKPNWRPGASGSGGSLRIQAPNAPRCARSMRACATSRRGIKALSLANQGASSRVASR